MAKPKRVHQIAKELGVNSKAIVAKCQEEGVPNIENHMSAVKLGLVQTIHDWFENADQADQAGHQAEAEADTGAGAAQAQAEAEADQQAGGTATATQARSAQGTANDADADAPAQAPTTPKRTAKKAARKKTAKRSGTSSSTASSSSTTKTTTAGGKRSAASTRTRRRSATTARTGQAQAESAGEQAASSTDWASTESAIDGQSGSKAAKSADTGRDKPTGSGSTHAAESAQAAESNAPLETDQVSSDEQSPTAEVEAQADQTGQAQAAQAAPSAEADHADQANETDQSVSADASAQAGEDQSTSHSTDEQSPEAANPEAQNKPTASRAKPNVPRRPDVVKPVGEQLTQPKSATLRGPKVIRVEEADNLRAPKPRGRRGEQSGRGGGRDYGNAPGVTRAKGPTRGGGVKGKSGDGGGKGEGPPRSKRRSRTSRRGRSGDSLPSGPAKFSEADMEELDARLKGSAGFVKKHRQTMKKRDNAAGPAQTAAMVGGKVEISEPITIKNLSAATGLKTAEIIKHLISKGVMATINSAVDNEMALEIALEYDIELDIKEQQTAQQRVEQEFEARETTDSQPRPPVVTVLGHVDHGKTSLLDKIRKADVAHGEFGGITQHIGAYRVTIQGADESDKTVVFLDTPGHAAFTTMRARGAKMTDLIVLVVAADDGVMPQTIESINHAKAAGVPIVVALNKSDLPQATDENVHRIYGQLAEHGLNPSEWGGQTEIVRTSAEAETGVTDLVEVLDYQAELLEVNADYAGPARGTVIEAEMQTGRGPVARALVQEGQLKVGDFIVSGRAYGRVRDMTDDRGQSVEQVGPATPVELSGLDEIPDAGDKFYVTDTLKKAQDVAQQFRHIEREQMLASRTKVTLDNFAEAVKAGKMRELRVVLKADVQGSVETIEKQLSELGNDEVGVKVLHSAVGTITESDVLLADASDGIIVGFHTGVTPAVREIADEHKVELRQYRVIYELIDQIKSALEGMLDPEVKEEEVGVASVKQVFRITKLGNIAGCLVTDGMVRNNAKLRVIRDGQMVTENRDVATLRRVKDDVGEVRSGTECGIRVDEFDDVKPDDLLVCYDQVEVQRTLD